MPNSYAILGTGALGGLYGGRLLASGKDVHFLCRSDYEFVRDQGLHIDSPWGDLRLSNVNCYQDAVQMPKVDVAIVSWKTTANASLADVLPAVCRNDTVVLVLQNGLDVEAAAADVVGAENVLGGCCFLCSNKVGPGRIKHLDYGKIAFGEYSQNLRGSLSKRMRSIAADLSEAGIPVAQSSDLVETRWRKLMWNIPFNGLNVVLNADTKEIMEDHHSAKLAKMLMEDVRRSAEACGIDIEPSFVNKMLADTRKMVPYASSMLLDFRNQRPLEVEAIVGNPLRLAAKSGFDATVIGALYQQLCFHDTRNRSLSRVD